MIYQLHKANLKRATTRKFLCSNDNSGAINVFSMLQELVVARGLLLIGSYGEVPVLEDKEGSRFRAICKGRGIQRWVELRNSKVAKPLPVELIPSHLSLAEYASTSLAQLSSSDSFSDLIELLE